MESTPLLTSHSCTAHLQPSHHRVTRHLHGELDTGPNNTHFSALNVVCFIYTSKKSKGFVSSKVGSLASRPFQLANPFYSNPMEPKVSPVATDVWTQEWSNLHRSATSFFLLWSLAVFANLKNYAALLMSLIETLKLNYIYNWISGSAIIEKLALRFKVDLFAFCSIRIFNMF